MNGEVEALNLCCIGLKLMNNAISVFNSEIVKSDLR